MSQTLEQISPLLQKGNMPEVIRLCNEAIAEGSSASDILEALLSGMGVIGERFKNNEVFVPEVLIAARAMNGGLDVIRPLLEEEGVESIGKVVIGTVKGDLHDIGKNLVAMMMTGAGFEVIDALTEKGLRDKVKVMVGGAPLTDQFAAEIGADKYTPDAATAAETAKAFVA